MKRLMIALVLASVGIGGSLINACSLVPRMASGSNELYESTPSTPVADAQRIAEAAIDARRTMLAEAYEAKSDRHWGEVRERILTTLSENAAALREAIEQDKTPEGRRIYADVSDALSAYQQLRPLYDQQPGTLSREGAGQKDALESELEQRLLNGFARIETNS